MRNSSTTFDNCSAISRYGAHNQRAFAKVELESIPGVLIWIEDVIALAEASASCSVFSILKREDEKWVTEHAFENPKFVEDVVRDVVLGLTAREEVQGFSVSCESIESIHNHSAFAQAGWTQVQMTLGTIVDQEEVSMA